MYHKMSAKNILTMSLSFPALIVGMIWFSASIYVLVTNPGTIAEKLNSSTAFYYAFASFSIISTSTIVASISSFAQSNVIRQIFKYSIITASILVGFLFVSLAALLIYRAN